MRSPKSRESASAEVHTFVLAQNAHSLGLRHELTRKAIVDECNRLNTARQAKLQLFKQAAMSEKKSQARRSRAATMTKQPQSQPQPSSSSSSARLGSQRCERGVDLAPHSAPLLYMIALGRAKACSSDEAPSPKRPDFDADKYFRSDLPQDVSYLNLPPLPSLPTFQVLLPGSL